MCEGHASCDQAGRVHGTTADRRGEDSAAESGRTPDHQSSSDGSCVAHIQRGGEVSEADPLIPIRDVPRAVARMTANSTKPSRSVVYRWLKNGNRGVKLKRAWVGSIQHTRESWLREFIEATATTSTDQPAGGRKPKHRAIRDRKSHAAATQRQLQALGL